MKITSLIILSSLAISLQSRAEVITAEDISCQLQGPDIRTRGSVVVENHPIASPYSEVLATAYTYYPSPFFIEEDKELGGLTPFFTNAETEASPGIRISVRPTSPIIFKEAGTERQAEFFSRFAEGPWKSVYISFFPSKEVRRRYLSSCSAEEGLNCPFNNALYGQRPIEFSTEEVMKGEEKRAMIAVVSNRSQLQFIESKIKCEFKSK